MHFSNTTLLVLLSKKFAIFKPLLSVSVLVVCYWQKNYYQFTFFAVSEDAKTMWVCFLIHKILRNKQTVPVGTCAIRHSHACAREPSIMQQQCLLPHFVGFELLIEDYMYTWKVYTYTCRRCQYFLNSILKSVGTFRRGCISCMIQITPGLNNTKVPHRPR